VGIAQGGAPALGAQQHQRLGAGAQDRWGPARCSRLALCRLSADTLKLGLGLLGIPSLERMGVGGVGIRGIQAAAFWPSGWNSAPATPDASLPFVAAMVMLPIAGPRELVDQAPA